ncbi:peptidase domain-containing ABC transporter [Xanthomonas graminis]|uniref:ABC transporter ATP-binding protein n=1 Tax=Xanthomonas graminis pv. poae TaxID=227946 RepID=A0A199NXV8_9XANT|nr:ATP-binding cassette domain-containing protein [Xanthomonas translucens]OAX53488.1 hypothetical protein A6R73_07175 [Xanthomonas translucens pv. poae]
MTVKNSRPKRLSIGAIIGPIEGVGKVAGLIVATALLVEICVLMTPMMLRIIIDRAIDLGDADLIVSILAIFVVIAVSQGLLTYGRSRMLMTFSQRLNQSWLSNLFDRMMALPLVFFEARGVFTIAAKFWSVSHMQRVLTGAFLEGILDGLLAVLGLVLLAYLAPVGALAAAAAMLLYGLFRAAIYRRQFQADAERSALGVSQQANLWETIAGIQTVRLSACEGERKQRWFSELHKQFRVDHVFQEAESSSRSMAGLLTTSARIAIVLILMEAVLAKKVTVGGLIATVAYSELFLSRAFILIDKLVAYRLLDVHRDKMQELLVEPLEVSDATRPPLAVHAGNASIELRGACLTVGGSRDLLVDGVLHARPGECIAIVGPSGAGKTSLTKALLGLIEFRSGTLEVAGVPIAQVRRRDYYAATATVLREDRLFYGTILDNIRMTARDADREWIVRCAADVGLHDYIQSLTDGYNTVIKDDGGHLSAGQRQRLLIARALCRRPLFLFLDEATSHLDPASEATVVELVKKLKATCIIVSHRPGPVELADRVYSLNEGKITQVR